MQRHRICMVTTCDGCGEEKLRELKGERLPLVPSSSDFEPLKGWEEPLWHSSKLLCPRCAKRFRESTSWLWAEQGTDEPTEARVHDDED